MVRAQGHSDVHTPQFTIETWGSPGAIISSPLFTFHLVWGRNIFIYINYVDRNTNSNGKQQNSLEVSSTFENVHCRNNK